MDWLNNLLTNFSNSFGGNLPRVLAALVILIIGLFLAGVVRRLVNKGLNRINFGSRVNATSKASLITFISKMVYYLAVLYVLLLVLDKMGVTGVLEPLKNMLNEFLSYIPNIIAAGIIGFAGYMIAKIASEAVGFVSEKFDGLSTKMGLNSTLKISRILKQIVFLFIFIPVLLVALDALQIRVISEPATEMLNKLMSSIPNIIAAALILTVFYVAGRYVIGILVELLRNLGVDDLSARMGLSSVVGENTSLSKVIGNIGFYFLMFGGIITAMEKLNFGQLSGTLTNLFELSGQIFLGLFILIIGNQISKWVANYIDGSGSDGLATIVRFATLGLFIAISLRAMGIANDIVNLAFGLTLGAVAVAFALSFGLGGREAAGKQMESFLRRFRKED